TSFSYILYLMLCSIDAALPSTELFILNTLSYDPCSNYVSLDQPWRANTGSGMGICDRNFNWNGWYRLFYYGMNIRMAESCVDVNRCGTYYTLWLNGPHPEIEDGVVTRQVCGNSGNDCCNFKSNPIRVKACPGNYYVYELLSPMTCNMAYCTGAEKQTPGAGLQGDGRGNRRPNGRLDRELDRRWRQDRGQRLDRERTLDGEPDR
uniref:UMOD/GP2/OIT3-like D8C domain-containing protein n=1 Tax=Astyanax mexicanus TaxID=7994 RepID=A0A3B1JWG9_ASTMX